MFKLISGLVAGAIILAPLFPAQAGYRDRSSGFGVSIGAPSTFGVSIGTPYGYESGYRNRVYTRGPIDVPYSSYFPGSYSPGYYSNGFSGSTVIVAPRAQTVILNPGFNTYPSSPNNYGQNCGGVIYGSPIVSPIPVNPYTGLACR